MEQIHGIDVSWMTHHGGPKDRSPNFRRSTFTVSSDNQTPRESSAPSPVRDSHEGADGETDHITSKGDGAVAQPKPIPPRPGFTREAKNGESKSGSSPGSPSLSRKPSWFSNLSSKFAGQSSSPPPAATSSSPTKDAELSVPKITPAKNAVLQHAAKHQGEGPYTPAPPRGTSQGAGGILHVFRRLSSSGAGQLGGPVAKGSNNHGLVERKVLNVDPHRERCPLEQLHQAKLRRVAFCVDVEIAPMPKYVEGDSASPKVSPTANKAEKRKLVEKGEGEALKNPKGVEEQKEQVGAIEVSGEQLPKEPVKEGEGIDKDSTPAEEDPPADVAGGNKKKEKKKRSEEERKARKEKKRKLAEANGQIPLEIHRDTDTSDPSAPTTPRAQVAPTTNPVRIYRRCCQLRETPILKKITEQLLAPSNTTSAGIVEKLDLTGYWMQVPDLITLGDFLAVVPVKEVLLENCGLTDEGLRVVLAGLLAVRKADAPRRRPKTVPDGLVEQGGVVERLVLKSNKIGPEGWKHLCLFIYMCRSLTSLDLADIAFPKAPHHSTISNGHIPHLKHRDEDKGQLDMYALFARSIGERLGGPTLELLNLSNTGLSQSELGRLLDGITKCGVRRLGLAHLDLDLEGLEHIKRYLTSGKCEGLDLGGNDLRDHCESLGSVIEENNTLWALSLAECNLKPSSLCNLLPHLAKLSNFRFLDLSHNQELFSSDPSAVGILRRCLPKLKTIKRMHLSDCALKSEQVIALAEVIPEMDSIAHISFLQNPELTRLANADNEETQEEASALYASLLAAARLSPNLVCIDIDVPTDGSGEIVKALAKQIVAYCLRNMERVPLSNGGDALGEGLVTDVKDPEYPDVLQHLVGHDIMTPDGPEDEDMAPDDDYIVGGTGVAKALACCLNNRGDESRSQSAELIREVEDGLALPKSEVPAGKAKDVSKHLLLSARKIRHRLHPALVRAKAMAEKSTEEKHTYQRLLFLQRTLDGIISRFEDEFPETKETIDISIPLSPPESHPLEKTPTRTSLSSVEAEREPSAGASDVEDETHFEIGTGTGKGSLSRQSSNLSLSSMALNREEGIALRAGHKFRYRWMLTSEQYQLLASTDSEELEKTPTLVRIINEMLDELGDEELLKLREEKGAIRVFKEHRQTIIDGFKQADPEYWDRFVESQEKARANVMPQERAVAERAEAAVVDDTSESAVSD
ncbi:Microtubules assembly and stabilization protein [Gnomoniopsis smithogilvyi]|uniref:Microtubules assembly and stabilization protein n=1 Tax=Gnomoniopsis smithogilvyi TaxID=1191159 RepID=A0A9W9D1R6_9PEZI|nr:Microtubules assembly and stabilization protein [Gnomoniopsis smithogilvyi]